MRYIALAALALAACDDRWVCERQIGRTPAYAADALVNDGFDFTPGPCAPCPPAQDPGASMNYAGDCGAGNVCCADAAHPPSGKLEFTCLLYRRQGGGTYCAAEWIDSD